MQKPTTILLDVAIDNGQYCRAGKRKLSEGMENLLSPHDLDASLDEGYRAMAVDEEREAEAGEWTSALSSDMTDEVR